MQTTTHSFEIVTKGSALNQTFAITLDGQEVTKGLHSRKEAEALAQRWEDMGKAQSIRARLAKDAADRAVRAEAAKVEQAAPVASRTTTPAGCHYCGQPVRRGVCDECGPAL